jgi:SRSO17 transposase
MTEQQLRALGPALSRFLDRFLFCCSYTQTFAHLNTYVHGLLSDLPRKTVEPIALRAGTPVRTLQEFLKDHAWDFARVRDLLQQHTAQRLSALPTDDLGAVGLIDETSTLKQGTKTPGVQRQYLGCAGKVQNGIVTVHLGVCQGRYKALIDAELYLPRDWSDDRRRCRQAGIPDEIVYRPKWQIALEQIDRARANGVRLDWLTFDEEYGKRPGFVKGLDDRRLSFVGEVPRSLPCLAVNRQSQRPPERLAGRPAEEVVRSGSLFRGQPWKVLRLARQSLPEQVWRAKGARVWLSSGEGWSAGTYWLIWASSDETGEEKFLLSNAPAEVALEVLVRVAFRRFHVEHAFRVCKSELGLSHFEGRNYVALMRHLSLCLVGMAFVADHTERLRGEKPGADDGAGVPGAARVEPGVAAGPTAPRRASVCA